MNAEWDILFTARFEKNAKAILKKLGHSKWLKGLARLRAGPMSISKTSKPLKGHSKAFRYRWGDLRVIYRAYKKTRSIVLIAAGHRGAIYNRMPNFDEKAVGEFSVGRMEHLIDSVPEDMPASRVSEFYFDAGNIEAEVEEILLDKGELFLIGIPEEYHATLLSMKSESDLESLSIPHDIRDRVIDYLTAPGKSHIDRVYSLDPVDGLESITTQSLDRFLVALDPQQKDVIGRILASQSKNRPPFGGGPWMIRGGPGTGKTLINLAIIKSICSGKIGGDLLREGPIRVGFVTFNKALSQSAERMFKAITREYTGVNVVFATIDSIVDSLSGKLAQKKNQSRGRLLEGNEQSEMLDHVFDDFMGGEWDDTAYVKEIRARRGNDFLISEFSETILGCDLRKEGKYLKYPRRGRKVALQNKERELIHAMFKSWVRKVRGARGATYATKRLAVLEAVELGKLNVDADKYDYLFVDELQDLSVVAIKILYHLVKHPEHIMFTADTAQSIYLRSPSWSDISDKIRFHAGNSFILRKSYRMTRQIDLAIRPLRLNSGDGEGDEDGIDSAVFDGPKPIWRNSPIGAHPHIAAEIAQELIACRGVNPGQVAVISPDKKTTGLVKQEFEKAGIPADVFQRETTIDIGSGAVHLLHAHVAKGLEFPFVIAVGVTGDRYPAYPAIVAAKGRDEEQEVHDRYRRLLYVALSRAARGLWLISDPERPSPLLDELNQDDWDCQSGV